MSTVGDDSMSNVATRMSPCRAKSAGKRTRVWRGLLSRAVLLIPLVLSGATARAQDELEEVFGGFGEASTEEPGEAPAALLRRPRAGRPSPPESVQGARPASSGPALTQWFW